MFGTSEEKEQVLCILSSTDKKQQKMTYFLCIDYINEILRNGNIDDYEFLIEITKLLFKIKFKDTEKYCLEKALINICYKRFNLTLFKLIETQMVKLKENIIKLDKEKFANVYCPFCILKMKYTDETPEDLDLFKKYCDKRFLKKIEQLTKSTSTNCKDSSNFNEIYCEFDLPGKQNDINSTVEDSYDLSVYFNLEYFKSRNNEFKESSLMNLSRTKKYKNNLERDLSRALCLFVSKRFTESKGYLKGIRSNDLFAKHEEIRLHIYHLLILCHVECAEYFECIHYIGLAMNLSLSSNLIYFYFLNLEFLIERIGGFSGPSSCLKIDINALHHNKDIEDIMTFDNDKVNGLLRDCKLKTQIILSSDSTDKRELRNIENKRPVNVGDIFPNQMLASKEYKVISFYIIEDFLYINLFNKVIKTNVNFTDLSNRLSVILNTSKDIMKRSVETNEEKAKWWLDRIELDKQLSKLLKGTNPEIEIDNKHVIIILDEKSTNFPWEHTAFLKDKHVYRVLSIEFLEKGEIRKNVRSISWIIDPENNLEGTRKRITNFLSSKNFNFNENNFELLLYFGHGGGSRYLRNLKNKILFLFGCCSSKILNTQNFKRNGKVLDHLSRGNTIIGCLWEVTDKDLDLISMRIIDNLFSDRCLVCIVKEAIEASKLRYLNGCSLVVYGMPTILT